MAMSKGQDKPRGYSEGAFGHGGHHRKDFKPAPVETNDSQVQNSNMNMAPAGPM